MKKYRYNISNLDCANCARKLEEELNKDYDLKDVVVNFSTSILSFQSNKDISLKELNKKVSRIEPDAKISNNKVDEKSEYNLLIFILGVIFGLLGIHVDLPFNCNFICLIMAYILFLYRPLINAIKSIRSNTIDENALITISCIGAFIVGQPMEGMMVIGLYTIGKLLESRAINNTRRSINDLINIRQDYANKKTDNDIVRVDIDDIKVNDILVVKKGERIPVDGVVVKGTTELDTSALTGESDPIKVIEDSVVLSGSINLGDIIEVRVTKLIEDSTVTKILELVMDATDKKSNTETFVSKISKVYTPIILLLAVIVALFLPIISNVTYCESIYRGLTFLVISCPCAIVISVPLSYFTGIGVSSKNGILIKGSNYLDNLHKVNRIVFDKTGTLTTGSFMVKNIDILDDKYKLEEIIEILVKGEHLSNHPIAKSIMKLTDKEVNNKGVSSYKEMAGMGISYKYKKHDIIIGTKKACKCDEDAILHLNIDGKHVASITIDDGIKDNALDSINKLKSLGIKTYMFTGDKKEVANNIGNKLGIDSIKFELLPTDKYNSFEELTGGDNVVCFVGDGINDAPVLKRADIGISMGGVGSSSAVEASDIVLMNDDLSRIPLAISISKYTNHIIKLNLLFAILVKVLVLLLSVFGIASMWMAIFADTGVTLITILNTLRIMNKYRRR